MHLKRRRSRDALWGHPGDNDDDYHDDRYDDYLSEREFIDDADRPQTASNPFVARYNPESGDQQQIKRDSLMFDKRKTRYGEELFLFASVTNFPPKIFTVDIDNKNSLVMQLKLECSVI